MPNTDKYLEWIKVEDEVPKAKEYVVAYSKGYYVCCYKKILTWSGWKLAFVNLLSSHGRWAVEDVTHWYRFLITMESGEKREKICQTID